MRTPIGLLGAIALFFMIVPGFAAYHSLSMIAEANWVVMTGASVEGTVTGVTTYRTGGRGGSGKTFVTHQFVTTGGQEKIASNHIVFGRAAFEEGEQVSISYLPEEPHRSHINSVMGRFSFLIPLLFTLPFFAGLIWLFKKDREEQKEMSWGHRRF